jgi:hypothetical protein
MDDFIIHIWELPPIAGRTYKQASFYLTAGQVFSSDIHSQKNHISSDVQTFQKICSDIFHFFIGRLDAVTN